jgi:hypothetical protein
MFYFSAHWCGPCRSFTPTFCRWYERHFAAKQLEVVFVSNDKNELDFKNYFSSMYTSSLKFVASAQRLTLPSQAMGCSLILRDADACRRAARRLRLHQFYTHSSCGGRRYSAAADQWWLPMGQEGFTCRCLPLARPVLSSFRFRQWKRAVFDGSGEWLFVRNKLPRCFSSLVQVAVLGIAVVRFANWYRQRNF